MFAGKFAGERIESLDSNSKEIDDSAGILAGEI